MPSIDWLYHRKRCVSCQRAREFLEANACTVRDQTDATKDRRGPNQALELVKSAKKVIVARGKKVVTFDMVKDPPDDQTLLAHVLGPSGYLRAPTLRRGQTLLIGYSDAAYRQFFGLE